MNVFSKICLLCLVTICWTASGCQTEQSGKAATAQASPDQKAVCVGDPPAAEEPQAEPEPQDEDRPFVSVGDQTLTAGQAAALIADGAARNEVQAADFWVKLKLKAAEARRRGLDRQKGIPFLMEVWQDHFLARMMDKEIQKDLPQATEEQARKKYEEDIEQYTRPFSCRFQHISVADKDLAAQVAEEAQKPGADFDQLIQKYSPDQSKADKSYPQNQTYEIIEGRFGAQVAEAMQKSKPGDILGPLPAVTGFEVIKVVTANPSEVWPFERVKRSILSSIDHKTRWDNEKKLVEDLKAKTKVVKSAELIQLEEKNNQQPATERKAVGTRRGGFRRISPTPGRRSKPPARSGSKPGKE